MDGQVCAEQELWWNQWQALASHMNHVVLQSGCSTVPAPTANLVGPGCERQLNVALGADIEIRSLSVTPQTTIQFEI